MARQVPLAPGAEQGGAILRAHRRRHQAGVHGVGMHLCDRPDGRMTWRNVRSARNGEKRPTMVMYL